LVQACQHQFGLLDITTLRDLHVLTI
jgi:hypothetical protein